MDNEEQKRVIDGEAGEDRKQTSSTRAPCVQVNMDPTIGRGMQEHERPSLAMLTNDESESEEDEDDSEDSSYDYGNNEYEFFEDDQLLDQEQEMPESQGSTSGDEYYMEDDDIDPDEMSYEELLELGEIIGQEKIGLSLNEIAACTRLCRYRAAEGKSGGIDRCVICQVEYEEGETLLAIPCDHTYHPECITKWLEIKKTCPICSNEVSPFKIVNSL